MSKGLKIFLVILALAVIGNIVGNNSRPVTLTPSTSSAATEPPAEENTIKLTTGQTNALRSAEGYLRSMAFSRSGLIQQLEFEGYSEEDATFAADYCGADWSEQAAKKAKDYLSMMAFSRDGLIHQLEFEGFTPEEAAYGASQNGY